MTGLRLLRQALEQAAPRLRPEVQLEASVLSLLGLVLLTVIWGSRGWLELDDAHWDGLFEAAVRPLVQSPSVGVPDLVLRGLTVLSQTSAPRLRH